MIRAHRRPVLILALLLLAAVGGIASAETSTPRTEATLSILSDSTAPDDPDDGEIPTLDVAKFLLNVSQNGADSVGPVVAVVQVSNASFPALPPACDGPASEISADGSELRCDLGPLAQGTTVAIEYEVRASGEVANGDLLTGSVNVPGTDPMEMPPLTITGTNLFDLEKRTVAVTAREGGPSGWYIEYQYLIRSGNESAKGSLPLSSVTFTDDWSDLLDTWPNATLVDQLDPGPAPHGDTGSWTISNVSAGSFDVTATGFGNSPEPGSSIVSSRNIRFFVPREGRTPGTLAAVNVARDASATPLGGAAGSVAEYDLTNNEAGGSVTVLDGIGTHNTRSAWVDPSYGREVSANQDPTISPADSMYRRASIWAWNFSSGGEQAVAAGSTVVAEALSEAVPWAVGDQNPDAAACILFERSMSGAGDAVLFGNQQTNPTVEFTLGSPVIEYATVADPTASSCSDDMATWSSSRPATFNAVRGWADVRNPLGHVRQLVLQVPVVAPADLPARTIVGFRNLSRYGNFGSTSLGSGGGGSWDGAGAYDPATNEGDNRFGDRFWVVPAIASFTKNTCGEAPTSAVGGTFDFCLSATLEGSGPLPGLKVVDQASYFSEGSGAVRVGLNDPESPVVYLPGTAVVTVNGSSSAVEPFTEPDGELSWSFAGVSAPALIEVRYTAMAQPGIAGPGALFMNTAMVEGDTLADYPGVSNARNPHRSSAFMSFAAGRSTLQIEKSKSSPDLIAPGEDVIWDIHLRNSGVTVIGGTEIIDVLPFNGDDSADRVPPSSFHGTVGLAEPATSDSDSGVFSYTSADPATVNSDPAHSSNRPGGSTVWCIQAAFGGAGCPVDLEDVTGVRFHDDQHLDVGAQRTMTLVMSTDGNRDGDIYTNDAGATVREGEVGPVLSIRSNDVSVTVVEPGLAIVKTTEDQIFAPGVINTYGIEVSNTSELSEPAAVVTDRLVHGLNFLEASDGAVFDPDTRIITWPAVPLAAGQVVNYTVTVEVDDQPSRESLVDGAVPNTATLTGERSCSAIDDECSSTVTNPVLEPHIRFYKTVDRAEARPGDTLTWTLEIFNEGTGPATDVVVSDLLPDGVSNVEARSDIGSTETDERTVTWTVGDLPAGASATASITAVINDDMWASTLVNEMRTTFDGDCFGDCPPPVVENQCLDVTASCATTTTPDENLPPEVEPPVSDPDPDPDPVPDPGTPVPPTEPPSEPPSEIVSSTVPLPRTGSDLGAWILVGGVLVAAGWILHRTNRSPSDQEEP